MGFLTESKLAHTLDLPVALPATLLKQGDWLVVASVVVAAGTKLTYQWSNLQILEASVDTADIASSNKIYGNLGLVYLTLRKDYNSETPGEAGALDAVVATDLGIFSRSAATVTMTTAGVYSLLVANNMQPSSTSSVPTSTSIDFKVSVTGQLRLEITST